MKNLIKVIKCDEIHHCDEILLTLLKTYGSDDSLSDENQSRWWKPLWWKFITVIEICTLIFDKNLLLRWKFITMMKIYHTDKIHHNDENVSHWWKFIAVMKIITKFIKLRIWGLLMNLINLIDTVLKIYHSDEKLIIWQKTSSIWWKFITGMKMVQFDETSLLSWKFITEVLDENYADEDWSIW